MGLYDKIKKEIHAKKGKSIFVVKKEKREDTGICGESTAKEIYSTIKIATDLTSLFCNKEG